MSGLGFGADRNGGKKPEKPKKGKAKGAAPRKTKGKLTARQARFVKEVKAGKTKHAAALVAGFAPSVARSTKHAIETKAVQEEIAKFQDDICAAFPNERLIQTLDAGLEATQVKVASIEGKITDIKAFVDHTERRQTVELIAEMSGRLMRRGNAERGAQVLIQFIRDPQTPAIQVATKPEI